MEVDGPGKKKSPRNQTSERPSCSNLGATKSSVDGAHGFEDRYRVA